MRRVVIHIDPINLFPTSPGRETIPRILNDYEMGLLAETIEEYSTPTNIQDLKVLRLVFMMAQWGV